MAINILLKHIKYMCKEVEKKNQNQNSNPINNRYFNLLGKSRGVGVYAKNKKEKKKKILTSMFTIAL